MTWEVHSFVTIKENLHWYNKGPFVMLDPNFNRASYLFMAIEKHLGTHMAIETECVSTSFSIGCVRVIRPVYNLA